MHDSHATRSAAPFAPLLSRHLVDAPSLQQLGHLVRTGCKITMALHLSWPSLSNSMAFLSALASASPRRFCHSPALCADLQADLQASSAGLSSSSAGSSLELPND